MRVLVTRPQADGERTAAKLREGGCDVLVAELLRVELLTADLGQGPWGALAMTSANAAAAVEQHPRRSELTALPVFTVGRHTATAARRIGCSDVTSADGNEKDLARTIAAAYRGDAPLLYLAGQDRAGNLAGTLASVGLSVRTVVVYRAAKATELPRHIQAELWAGRIEGVLHYSRRSAEAYLDCARATGVLERALAPVHFCLSPQVAEPLIAAGVRKILIAPRPEDKALINLVLA